MKAKKRRLLSKPCTNINIYNALAAIATLREFGLSEEIRENKTNMTSREQVKAILEATRILDKKKDMIYEQLMGELEPQGIRIINFNRLSGDAEGSAREPCRRHTG